MSPATRLFDLLPSVYRVRDADHGKVLEALLAVLDAEAERLEQDVERLYDNWFVETCDDWVVPYVGDLLGVRTLVPIEEGTFSRRAIVANTLAYRRGKGTAATLEQLARDVTGWPARAVEMFELIGTTQFLNHLRLHNRRIDLRDWNGLELIDTPFDQAAHTVDVRHVDNRRGRHNVMNVALFLWRLGAYPLQDVTPEPAGPGLYRFGQLGADLPLFTHPLTETEMARLATEANVPGPLRRAALYRDLGAYRSRNRSLAPEARPEATDYYGRGRSAVVSVDGADFDPMAVVAADLSAWSRPPAAVTGRASGTLDPFPALSSPAPSVDVTVGAVGPRTATLAAVPATIEEARSLLQEALRTAHGATELAAVVVAVVGDRLVVLPGTTGDQVTFAASAADATTVSELKLGGASTAVAGILSRRLTTFPELPAEAAVEVSGAGHGPHEISLAPVPVDAASARAALETALRGAAPSPAFSGAEVALAGDRLLILPGVDGFVLRIRPTAGDPQTAWLLGLSDVVAIDPRLGRLAFAVGAEPAGSVTVSYGYGFAADVGGGPYDRRVSLARLPEAGWSRTVSQTDPGADFTTVAAALAAWADPGDGNRRTGRVTIEDNGTYAETLAVPSPADDADTLAIVAAQERRPTLRLAGDLTFEAGAEPRGGVILDGLLVEGGIVVEAASIERLRVEHCTLVPGRALTGDGRPARPGAASVVVPDGNERLEIEIERSITGALAVHEEVAALVVRDSIVDSPSSPAFRAALSGNLAPFPALTTAAPSVSVTIGDHEPRVATLRVVPSTLAEARTLLEEAIRDAHWAPAFREARVGVVANRLLVLAGTPEDLAISPAGMDPTAAELRLDDAAARAPLTTSSVRLQPFPTLTSASPAVGVDFGGEPRVAVLSSVPATLAGARSRLQSAIRAAGAEPAFAEAVVAAVGGSLVVVPGDDDTVMRFHSVPADRTTAQELGLSSTRPAISFSDDGAEPGPRATLERVTVFGEVRVRELALASESIFFDPVVAVRRQLGCVRFSYVAPGSLAPRRYRCQPSEAPGGAVVRPVFTSASYGHPAYAQLAASCPSEIAAGAEDEGEMGAFNLLQQNQRIENLQASLDEYLRFGLEAGIFLAT